MSSVLEWAAHVMRYLSVAKSSLCPLCMRCSAQACKLALQSQLVCTVFQLKVDMMAPAHDVQITHEGHAPSICITLYHGLRQEQNSHPRSRFRPPEAMTGGAPKTCSPLEPLHPMRLGLSRTAEGCPIQWHLPAATAIGTTWTQASYHSLYAHNGSTSNQSQDK